MSRISQTSIALVVLMTLSLARPAGARAQSPPQPIVDLPPIELATGMSFKRAIGNDQADRRWVGPDVTVAIGHDVRRNLAVAAQVETDFHESTTLLGGAQLATDFFYGGSRDPVPGRFIGRVLAGVATGGSGPVHPVGQLVVGADILISRTRAVAVRWEAGYELTGGDMPRPDGRIAIGLVFGPHLHNRGGHP